MDVTREIFTAYERVRVRGLANMNKPREVARTAGIPQRIALDIAKHYSDYMDRFGIETYIKRIEHPAKRVEDRVGYFFMPYDDLVAVFGQPTVDIRGDGIDVVWSLPTTYGFVVIYTPSHSTLLVNKWTVKIIRMWHIRAETPLADEVIEQQLYAYATQKQFKL